MDGLIVFGFKGTSSGLSPQSGGANTTQPETLNPKTA